ncbi:MAG: metalloregulator ArsR/SmtB family transcription factor [Burkholderiales bacterium]|nr:metalloregulator ArsR/SmtB family transcription factor [Burkholderiales bacterium]
MEPHIVITALSALAQESRLAIFRLLVEAGPAGMAAGRIGDALKLAPATLSFHLKELHRADLILSSQDGRFIYYRANFQAMNGLLAYLTENCCRTVCGPTECGTAGDCSPPASLPRARPKEESQT